MNRARSTIRLVCFLAGMLGAGAHASIIAVGPNAFPSTATVVDFTGLSAGTEVNGLVVDGVQFTYVVGGVPQNGAVEIDGGPGITNHIAPPDIVSVGNNAGTLIVTLPHLTTLFGYGFADLNTIAVPNATTISVLSGPTLLGSLSFAGAPDPHFTGGFAGLQSSVPFDGLYLTFNPSVGPAFALDNLTFATGSSVPEPSTMLIVAIGFSIVAAIGGRSRLPAFSDRARQARLTGCPTAIDQ